MTAIQKKQIENFLNGYSSSLKLLRLERYEADFFGGGAFSALVSTPSEAPLAKAKMYEVRHFVLSLGNCDERLLLYYHYLKGESVAKCAELLGVSERTAFRLKNKALALAFCEASKRGILN